MAGFAVSTFPNGQFSGAGPLPRPATIQNQNGGSYAAGPHYSDVDLSEDRPTSKAESASDPESDEGVWVTPTAAQQAGGKWLKGKHITVYWDGEQRWYDGKVLTYDPDPTLIDSHGAYGPLHLVRYEDGDYEENLANATWKLLAIENNDTALSRESSVESDDLSDKPWTSRIAGQKRSRPPDDVMKEQSKAALLRKAHTHNQIDSNGFDDLNPSFLRTREDGEGKGSRIRKPSQKMKMAMTDFAYDTGRSVAVYLSVFSELLHC